ncbi:MAG: nucleotidyltransferase [Verrucomicrobiae bacterium]|nr:nucleotidyltransferase [Verrucomicrobiae bacterium]
MQPSWAAVVLQPCYPASDLYRVMNDDSGLQVDFMVRIHGIKSFNSVRCRAVRVHIGGHPLWVASLEDIIKSKRAAARPRDNAVIEILERTWDEKIKLSKRSR